jgi:hypothetical protein
VKGCISEGWPCKPTLNLPLIYGRKIMKKYLFNYIYLDSSQSNKLTENFNILVMDDVMVFQVGYAVSRDNDALDGIKTVLIMRDDKSAEENLWHYDNIIIDWFGNKMPDVEVKFINQIGRNHEIS